MGERRSPRIGLKVIHRHRVGARVSRRVSELVFVRGQPKALLGWINLGGVRTPLYMCDLDPLKLRVAKRVRGLHYYEATTVDPRFEDFTEEASQARWR